jgi:hypothetical protein
MDDELLRAEKPPGWFWAVAIACLAYELVGCFPFYLQVTTDPEVLAVDQRAVYEATPYWITGAYGLAVIAGLVGAIALLQRLRLAKGALAFSLVMIAVQFGGIALVPELRESIPSDQLLGPILIIGLAYGFWQFAKLADRRRWLR